MPQRPWSERPHLFSRLFRFFGQRMRHRGGAGLPGSGWDEEDAMSSKKLIAGLHGLGTRRACPADVSSESLLSRSTSAQAWARCRPCLVCMRENATSLPLAHEPRLDGPSVSERLPRFRHAHRPCSRSISASRPPARGYTGGGEGGVAGSEHTSRMCITQASQAGRMPPTRADDALTHLASLGAVGAPPEWRPVGCVGPLSPPSLTRSPLLFAAFQGSRDRPSPAACCLPSSAPASI